MTLDEAKKIARIVGTADNGCSSCVNALVTSLNEAELGFKFKFVDETIYRYFKYIEGNEVNCNEEESENFESYLRVDVDKL